MKTVILAAGFGSRLWPLSISEKPKQFQPLIGDESLLRYTYSQLGKIVSVDDLYVLVLSGMEQLVREELPRLQTDHIIVVPERRNTLPHTMWALSAITSDPNEPVLFKSVDHFIVNPEAFARSLRRSINRYNRDNSRLTLLCTPYASFNSNDGYCVTDNSGRIEKFLEKPTQKALETLAKGKKIYRSPMIYIASRATCLNALRGITHKEPWVAQAEKLLLSGNASRKPLFLDLPFLDISSTVFQHSSELMVDEIEYEFIDVGRFEEIYQLNNKDAQGNVIIGNVILGNECRGNLIINKRPEPLVAISISNSVIVQTSAGSLVAPLQDADQIGEIYKTRIHASSKN